MFASRSHALVERQDVVAVWASMLNIFTRIHPERG